MISSNKKAILGCSIALLFGLTYVFWPRHLIVYNARIITMAEKQPEAQALVVKGDRIALVGDNAQALSQRRWYSRILDLQGGYLLPGFVDAHSHFLSTGLTAVSVDLNPPPDGDIDSREQLYARLGQVVAQTPQDQWIIGFNYDNTAFADGQHPDKKSLDVLAPRHKIWLRHNSGHMGVSNSAGLEVLLPAAPWAAGPLIGRYPRSNEPNGLLFEQAAPKLNRFFSPLAIADNLSVVRSAVHQYVSQGVTTAQDGVSSYLQLQLYRWLSALQIVPMRLNLWAVHDGLRKEIESGKVTARDFNSDRLSLSVIKLFADGSPQGYTAFLSKPYLTSPSEPGYKGYPHTSDQLLQKLITRYRELGWVIAVHANGDAAIDLVLRVLEKSHEQTRREHRQSTGDNPHTILVHAQTIRKDQIKKLRRLGVSPSYFPTHTYYWGEWHLKRTLGPERAAFISPLKSTDEFGIRYSIHTDAPVAKMLPMQLLWSATERKTRKGKVLGPDQRISRRRALRAMTLDAAWQNGVDGKVGSLEIGKLADFVVLSGDPLSMKDVRDIRVLSTYVGGKRVYHAEK